MAFGKQAFFRGYKRVYSQLLVVLPGETFAPGTPTGKTGTPTPVSSGTIEGVTVYAVDSTFDLMSGKSDSIALTCSDLDGIAPLNVTMVNGVATFLAGSTGYYLLTTGSQTITAADSSNANILPGTSSALTVQ